MKHRTIRGHIDYVSRKPELMNQMRGGEDFHVTIHEDGHRVIRAFCEIAEPDPTVMRDIIYSLDANDRPMDCHVRLVIGNRFMGSGWFRFDHPAGMIECESYGPSIGRLSQTREIGDALDGFGTHPIFCDGYLCKCIDLSKGPHARTIRVYLPSPDHRGATPPMISEVKIGLEYVGEEEVTVKAGTFKTRHFRFVDDVGPGMGGNQHPPYDVWLTADDDYIFVQGGVAGYMQTWYELAELER